MKRNCDNCGIKVSFSSFYKQMLKNRYSYVCDECGTMHKATIPSRILNFIIYILPLIYIIAFRHHLSIERYDFLLLAAWIFISGFIVQPLVLQYKKKDTQP